MLPLICKLGTPLDCFITTSEPFELALAPGTIGCLCQFDLESYGDHLFHHNQVTFEPRFLNAAPKRKAEFLAGRIAARRALEQFGAKETSVGVGIHGAPIWPTDLTGSITHQAGVAICVVGFRANYRSLGIDLEPWIRGDIASGIRDIVLQPQEEMNLKGNGSPDQVLTIAFSAKESLFKALFPFAQDYFDFHSATLVKVDWEKGTFILNVHPSVCPQERLWNIEGALLEWHGCLFTYVPIPAGPGDRGSFFPCARS